MSKQTGTTDITLATAHKIHVLRKQGSTQTQIADDLQLAQSTVSRVLSGDSLSRIRRVADRMEAFVGGVVVGNGNYRFHASAPNEINQDGHSPSKAQHTLGTSYENDRYVPPTPCILAELLAEEDILARLAEAGISEDEVLYVDHHTDLSGSYQFGKGCRHKRDPAIHLETWDEFMKRAEADGIADRPGAILKRLENEGQDVDIWWVRDLDFKGWPSGPWVHPNDRQETVT